MLGDEFLFSPFLTVSGIYNFNKLQDDIASTAVLPSAEETIRARVEAGAGFLVPGRNILLSGEGFYDGIGAANFQSFGGTLSVWIPF